MTKFIQAYVLEFCGTLKPQLFASKFLKFSGGWPPAPSVLKGTYSIPPGNTSSNPVQ